MNPQVQADIASRAVKIEEHLLVIRSHLEQEWTQPVSLTVDMRTVNTMQWTVFVRRLNDISDVTGRASRIADAIAICRTYVKTFTDRVNEVNQQIHALVQKREAIIKEHREITQSPSSPPS